MDVDENTSLMSSNDELAMDLAELSANVAMYRGQLEEVHRSLQSDPHDAEALEMRAALEEVLQLSIDLLASHVSLSGPLPNPPITDEQLPQGTSSDAAATDSVNTPPPAASLKRKLNDRGGEEVLETLTTKRSKVTAHGPPQQADSVSLPGVTPRFCVRGRGMHPRNKYLEKAPDFEALAAQYSELRPYVKAGRKGGGRSWINWKDLNATRELTRVLLLHDFGVEWCLPDGHLCPPLPNRVNYLLWLEDLLTLHPATWHAHSATPVLGLDIGTGASCIYPLLGASMLGWQFVGTDVTAEGLHGARQNVQRNPHLSSLITIRDARSPTLVEPAIASEAGDSCHSPNLDRCHATSAASAGDTGEGQKKDEGSSRPPADSAGQSHMSTSAPASCHPILLRVVQPGERFEFCMCNPPFFERMEEAGANPATACGGSAAEMVYPGGEVVFISKMIDDSAEMKHQVHWFSSLVGKKQHLKGLIARLRRCQVSLIQSTEFVQGKTSRWGLAWSYTCLPPGAAKGQLQARSKLSFTLQGVGRQVSAWEVVLGLKAVLDGGGGGVHRRLRILSHSGVIQFAELMERAEADLRSSFPTKANLNR